MQQKEMWMKIWFDEVTGKKIIRLMMHPQKSVTNMNVEIDKEANLTHCNLQHVCA
jgi:hypothetical protein